MANWKEIHPDFTEELQKEWEDKGFGYESCKSWIELGGCRPHEAELTRYLVECQRNEFDKNIEIARTEYPKWKELGFDLETIMLWKKQDFTSQQATEWTSGGFQLSEAQEWRRRGFTFEQTKECLEFGLTPQDIYFCLWLRNSKQLTQEQVLNHHNLEQLNQEFFNWWQEQQQTNIEIPPKNS